MEHRAAPRRRTDTAPATGRAQPCPGTHLPPMAAALRLRSPAGSRDAAGKGLRGGRGAALPPPLGPPPALLSAVPYLVGDAAGQQQVGAGGERRPHLLAAGGGQRMRHLPQRFGPGGRERLRNARRAARHRAVAGWQPQASTGSCGAATGACPPPPHYEAAAEEERKEVGGGGAGAAPAPRAPPRHLPPRPASGRQPGPPRRRGAGLRRPCAREL